MTKMGIGKSAEARSEYWRARIAEQEHSGRSVGRFGQEQQITEPSFYAWRKRLRPPEPVRFALVERAAAPRETAPEPTWELVLKTGARLRMGRGVEAAALRAVWAVLRA